MNGVTIMDKPLHYKVYAKSVRERCKGKIRKMVEKYNRVEKQITALRPTVIKYNDIYNTMYGINLYDYDEFLNEKYINGKLNNDVKTLVRKNDSSGGEKRKAIISLLRYANMLTTLHELKTKVNTFNKIINIDDKQYAEIVRKFYTAVQKELILKGNAYYIDKIGTVCINACKVNDNRKKVLNWKATRERKAELINQGVEIYDEHRAKQCKKEGIPYHGVDYRVYLESDIKFQIVLLKTGRCYKFTPSDYRALSVRGKTNDELIEECGRDVDKIFNLNVDMKTKLNMMTSINKTLYTKYIRTNELHAFKFAQANSKNRQ